MSDRHVVPAESGWNVEKENAKRPSATATTQAEAVKRAVEIVANDGGGQVVVHGADGAIRETRTVEAGADDTTAQAAGAAATSAARGAQASASRAADTVEESAGKIADTAEDIADDVSAAGRRVNAEVTRTARQAGDALVDGTDRAADVGDDLGGRLQTASHRTGEYIHSVTERVAHPIDAAARALNPIRIAGRTAGVVIAGALHVSSVVTRRGTRDAQRSARAVTGRR